MTLSLSSVACGTRKAVPLTTPETSDDGGASLPAPVAATPIGTPLIADTALCTGGGPSVGLSPLRRISRVEYDNMVHDLLGDTTQPAQSFVAESPLAMGVNFQANTYTQVTSTLIPQQYLQAAETLAATAVTGNGGNDLTNLVPCGSQASDSCVQQWFEGWAARAFRAPLDPDESASLWQIYTGTKAQFDYPTAVQALITAVLTSPRFLFVFELGSGDDTSGVVALTPYEVAARLSLFLWRSVPDPALMTAAAGGQLATADQVEAQATRMMAMPNATSALQDFATQWLELQNTAAVTKDVQFNATWSPALAADLKTETLTTVASYFQGDQGSLGDLLTSPSSYVNQDVAKFYGVAASGNSGTFTLTNVNPDPSNPVREGILMNGSVLATEAHTSLPSPVLRGKLVREQVLCDPMQPPPAGLNIPPPPATVPAGSTTRDTFEAHSKNPQCSGCHQLMDPIGLGFGNFDATGAYQATDSNGLDGGTYPPIDASGAVNPAFMADLTTTFADAKDLVHKLAAAPQVQQCFALQEVRYALSRVETKADACSAQQIYQAFSSSGFALKSLLTAVVRSDAFRYRTTFTPGSSCQ